MRRMLAKIKRVGFLKPVARTKRTVRKLGGFIQSVNEAHWRQEQAETSRALRSGTSKNPTFDLDRLIRAEKKLRKIEEKKIKKMIIFSFEKI